MKWLVMFAALLAGVPAAGAQDAPSQNWLGGIKNLMPTLPALPAMPSVTMPDLSMPDVSQLGDDVMRQFTTFTQQVGDTLPILEEMGFEVTTFRVQWGLPPRAKLRLRSRTPSDPAQVAAIAAKASGGVLIKALVSSAAEAKRIQSMMKLGTAILDVDFALTPKVKMSFLNSKTERKDERDIEDLDLVCAQALN